MYGSPAVNRGGENFRTSCPFLSRFLALLMAGRFGRARRSKETMKFQNKLSAIAAIVFMMGSAVLVQKAAAQSTNPPWRNLSLDQLSGVHWRKRARLCFSPSSMRNGTTLTTPHLGACPRE